MTFQRDTNVLVSFATLSGKYPSLFRLEIVILIMPLISHFGIVTIATNWLFVIIALGAVILALLLSLSRRQEIFSLEDCVTAIALIIGVGLACQTTWAIVLEGNSEHQSDFTGSQVMVLARVCRIRTFLLGYK
jgi:predicted ABC-type exoprotein transport system permease subunit